MHINEVLMSHFEKGVGAAGYLRGRIDNLTGMLDRFFKVRSDIKRIIESEKVAEAILATMDFNEILELRRQVANLEIKRIIKYGKQNDHTAHTVYLFLVGVWMYDNVKEVRDAINQRIKSSQKEKMFIFQWIISSLLHDIGYLFYETTDVENETWHLFLGKQDEKLPAYKVYGALYDKFFQDAFENRFMDFSLAHQDKENAQAKKTLTEIWDEFQSNNKIETRKAQSPSDVLDILSSTPWMEVLNGERNGFSILENEKITKSLKDFAYQIAVNGYSNNKDPRTDHAIASGLMLLQYISIWYWLSLELNKRNLAENDTKNAVFFRKIINAYPLGVLLDHVIPACQVAIYHNISDKESITLKNEPLMYLAILCDELQVWDRFVAGDKHLSEWENAETHCMAENVSVDIDRNHQQISFIFEYPRFREKVVDSLNNRLNHWDRFIKIN